MASRSKPSRRRESDTDSLEALKPLVVLGLLGMILYGAYSVVQKGSSPHAPPASEAPPFAATPPAFDAPQVDLPAAPAVAMAPPAAAPPPPPMPPAEQTPPAVAAPPAAESTTYLNALSAPPPANDDVAAIPPAALPTAPSAPPIDVTPGAAALAAVDSPSSPDFSRQAPPLAMTAPPPLEPSVPDAVATPAAAPAELSRSAPQSTAFAMAWADSHDKLAAGRYAEALAVLSAWHDDPSLGLEESQRLEELLAQLAGTVIYSQQDLLMPPHVVAPGESLESIAAPLGVPWQLLAKINGVDHPTRLVPGEALKLVRGPFDAVVSVSRRRLSLQLAGNYAGTFPVVVGKRVQERVGASLAVAEVRREVGGDLAAPASPAAQVSFVQQGGTKSIVLGDGLRIEAAEDPGSVSDSAPEGSLIVSPRDLDELIDILGLGSHVLIRQ